MTDTCMVGRAPAAARVRLAAPAPQRRPTLDGRVVVLDIAFAATVGTSISFELHDPAVPRRRSAIDSPRGSIITITSATRASRTIRASCSRPRRNTARVPRWSRPSSCARPARSIASSCTSTSTGCIAAAKWILGGEEPYRGADADARAVDTRIGTPGPAATRIDRALRAKFRDDQLKRAVIQFLVGGMKPGVHDDVIREAAAEFERRDAPHPRAREAVHDPRPRRGRRHRGRRRASSTRPTCCSPARRRRAVSIVRDSGMLTIAAPFESGWDFVALFELGGGMPTRVTIPEQKLDGVIAKINDAPAPTPRLAV